MMRLSTLIFAFFSSVVIAAAMNTAGQIGSIACPLLVVWLRKHYDWNAPLHLIEALFSRWSRFLALHQSTLEIFE